MRVESVDESILNKYESDISNVLLFGDHLFVDVNSTSVLFTTIENISSKRFYAFNGE